MPRSRKATLAHAMRIMGVNTPTASPLDLLQAVMRCEDFPDSVRIDAAKASAPYIHPRRVAQHQTVDTVGRTFESWLNELEAEDGTNPDDQTRPVGNGKTGDRVDS